MVNLWRRFGVLIGFGLFLPGLVLADSRMYPEEVVLGNPVTWIISGEQVENDFEQLDLSVLKQHFVIHDIEGGSSRLRLRLYPYEAGVFQLPAMHHGGLHVKPITIHVQENPEVSVTWQAPQEQAYPDEVLYWRADVSAKGENIPIRVLATENDPNQAYQWLGTAEPKADHTLFENHVRLISAVRFLKPGAYSLPSPGVRVDSSAYRHELFFAPPQTVQVRPMPSYLPAVLPVGQVSLNADFNPFWVVTGDLYHWVWRLNGQNVTDEQLPNLASQLTDTDGFEWLMPTVERTQAVTESGLMSRAEIDQPFRILEYGWVRLPALRVTYFNPQSGRLEDVVFPAQSMVALPGAVIVFGQLLLALLALVSLRVIWLGLREAFLKWRLLAGLKQADSVLQVWQQVDAWSSRQLSHRQNGQAWPVPVISTDVSDSRQPSLGSWLQVFESEYGESAQARTLVDRLNEQLYSERHPAVKLAALEWAKSLPLFKVSFSRLRRF